MITIENTTVSGWDAAIRGMRNPMNSWHYSDSNLDTGFVGPDDLSLMTKLVHAGTDHAKFMRMIHVSLDITAPLYWWKEFDTYKVGTVSDSCSTMHKIQVKEFTLGNFSHEHLEPGEKNCLEWTIATLNTNRELFNTTQDKKYWWNMIQLLPSSYNQRRTIDLNYQVLANQYQSRKNHKLDEWRDYCEWVKTLPYSGLITGENDHAV